jgi:hypothetical protein
VPAIGLHTRDVSPELLYLLDGGRVLLAQHLVNDGSRKHMAGYVPSRSGKR